MPDFVTFFEKVKDGFVKVAVGVRE